MNTKAIALGAVIGFVMAVTTACPANNTTCDSSNCGGCCNTDGTCVELTSENNATCGASGNACAACANTEVCTSGACVPTTPGHTDAGMDAGVIDTGCVLMIGGSPFPRPGDSFANCGNHGEACKQCSSGQICAAVEKGGECQTKDAGPEIIVGQACTMDSDCSSIPDGICKLTTSLGNGTYTGGYCTRLCSTQEDCGSDNTGTKGKALCIPLAADKTGEEDLICWSKCTSANDCREGYNCYQVGGEGSNLGACLLDPMPTFDGGWAIGGPCTTNDECHPPTTGQCIDGDAGFPDGMCTAECFSNPGLCGADGVCLCTDQDCTAAACFAGCEVPGDHSNCRTGYTCVPLNQQTTGVCEPDCTATGCDASKGQTCMPNGFCEVVDAGM